MSKHRRRVLVALIPQSGLSGKIRAVASLFGQPRRERIPPHVTVVPPINLSEDDLVEARAILRRVASETKPFQLGFSSLASFAPSAATVHLAVADEGGHLAHIRDQIRSGPLSREDPREFSPHITLVTSASDEQIQAALMVSQAHTGAAGPLGTWDVDRIFMLEQIRSEAGTSWQILAEEPFARAAVVGRGGIELNLRSVGHLEPASARLLEQSKCSAPGEGSGRSEARLQQEGFVQRDGVRPPEDVLSFDDSWPVARGNGGERLCVSAEFSDAPGTPVGVAVGRVFGQSAWLDGLVTDESHRRMGIARHVLAQWCYQSAERGAVIALCAKVGAPGRSGAALNFDVLEELGFATVGNHLIRQLQ
ncbi:MAG: GNAT family N-acetyltransferase [Microthrixaceae bacterium]